MFIYLFIYLSIYLFIIYIPTFFLGRGEGRFLIALRMAAGGNGKAPWGFSGPSLGRRRSTCVALGFLLEPLAAIGVLVDMSHFSLGKKEPEDIFSGS